MKTLSRRDLTMFLAALALAGGGCGGPGGGPAESEAELYGVVKNKGRAVAGGSNILYNLIFEPVAGGAPVQQQLSEDGTYSITVPDGEYNVRVEDGKGKQVGKTVKITASEPLTQVDIDVTGP